MNNPRPNNLPPVTEALRRIDEALELLVTYAGGTSDSMEPPVLRWAPNHWDRALDELAAYRPITPTFVRPFRLSPETKRRIENGLAKLRENLPELPAGHGAEVDDEPPALKLTAEQHAYVDAVTDAINDPNGIRPEIARYLTPICTECDRQPTPGDGEHVLVDSPASDEAFVLIGCEGYYLVDPSMFGIYTPNWSPVEG